MPRKDPEARRAYHREYQQRWYREHRQLHIARVQVNTRRRRALFREQVNVLKQRPCADCGVQYPPYIMDFDHVAGEKLDAICNMRRRLLVWDTILTELEKCEVVCANCHRMRTRVRSEGRAIERNRMPAWLGGKYVLVRVPVS